MANDSFTQQALAADLSFHGRVRSALSSVAFQVMNEDPTTPNHDQRVTYARQVINTLAFAAPQVSTWLVERPNLIGAETTYDFQKGNVVSAATDAAIQSQLMTDWDLLAGNPPPTAPAVAIAPPKNAAGKFGPPA
jgi:hypothetical protein